MAIFECRDYTLKADIYWNDTYQDYSARTDNIVKPKFEPLDKIQQIEDPPLISSTTMISKKGTLPKEFKNYGSQETSKRESLNDPKVTTGKPRPKKKKKKED